MNFKILIADNDENVIRKLKDLLTLKGYTVRVASSGSEVLKISNDEIIHLIITEVNLPDVNGLSLCKDLRVNGFTHPILFFTDNTSDTYPLIALEIGAQDYIKKTSNINELIARVDLQLKSQFKREISKKFKIKDLEIDLERRTVTLNGKVKELAPKEFQIFFKLAQSPKKVFSREELLLDIWGFSSAINTRTLDIHIGYLRKKIEDDPTRPKLFRTVRGVGYCLEID